MPRSTPGDLENCTSSYCTTSIWLPHGSRNRVPRPGSSATPGRARGGLERVAGVDDEAHVTVLVGGQAARRREGDELIAGIEEGHPPPDPPAQLEAEQAAVELQRRIDVADLERHVVDPDQASACVCHVMNLSFRRGPDPPDHASKLPER